MTEPSKRATSWRTALLVALSSVLATAVLIEAGARVWLRHFASARDYRRYALYADIDPRLYRWSPHHYLNYYPTPNFRIGRTHHNSLGFRGPEFPLKKPPGTFRIVAIGGSTIYDSSIKDDAKTFTAQLEKALKKVHGFHNVQVINAGAGGYTSWESLINLEFRILDLEPDLIIDYDAYNDVHSRVLPPEIYRGDASGQRKPWQLPPTTWWDHSCALRILHRRWEGRFSRVGLETLVNRRDYWKTVRYQPELVRDWLKANPPLFFERNVNSLIAVARAHGARVMLATFASSSRIEDYSNFPVFQQALVEHNLVLSRVAEEQKVPLFDFAAVMPEDAEYWADSRHSNAKGARLKAKLFAEFIARNGLIHSGGGQS